MFLAIGSYTFPWAVGIPGYDAGETLTASGIIEYAAAKNIQYVQFGDNMPLHRQSRDCLHIMKQKADEHGIHIEVGTRGLKVNNILQYISIAEIMHSPFIRIVIDESHFQPGSGQVIKIIRELLPALRDKGIQLGIENHDRFRATDLEQIILETDPAYIGICLDTANSIGGNEGIRETIAVLAPYTINLHLKDVIIRRVAHKMGFTIEGTAAGEGILDMPWIVERLKPYKKCKTVLLELWLNPEATIVATLVKEKEMVERSIKYLKRILL